MYLEFSPRNYSQMGGRPRVCEMSDNNDHMDRIPDSLLLPIFNKLDDIKSLGRCCAVCKRFNTLVPQVDNVIVKVDCMISRDESGLNVKGNEIFGRLMRFVLGSIVNPCKLCNSFWGTRGLF